MKKFVCFALFLMTMSLSAQSIYDGSDQISVGVNAGLPIGDLAGSYSAGFGIDFNYLYSIGSKVQIGGATGYLFFMGKDVNGVKAAGKSYIPIAGAIRFNNEYDRYVIGTDLGYAIGITPSGDKGGVYFKPYLGYKISNNVELNLSYIGVKKKDPAYSYVALGLMFKI
ncbi:hypothetical protein [Tenacibaculum sp. UWU-22]|uniref:hypothetical protein n=1 Tax=Tenacibaculum sp. UWU-22 TaxID=3234187 RepID=UPI0034DB37D7